MVKNDHPLSGTMTPIDINSEEFKKKADEMWKKIKKQGYMTSTNIKEYENLSPDEVRKKFKNLCTISIDIEQ